MCSATSEPVPGSSENVGTLITTSYPTPFVSRIAWFGCFASKVPRRCAIIRGSVPQRAAARDQRAAAGRKTFAADIKLTLSHNRQPFKDRVFLPFPQEPPSLHSFFTNRAPLSRCVG